MLKEKSSPERQSLTLKEKFSQLGINTVVVDLDGTLIDTKKVFDLAIIDASSYIAFGVSYTEYFGGNPDVRKTNDFPEPIKDLVIEFHKIIVGLRNEFKVSPSIMEAAVQIIARNRLIPVTDTRVDLALKRIGEIYSKDLPELFAGAEKFIKQMKSADVNLILATHAGDKWTWRKLMGVNLSGKFDRVFCFPVHRSKGDKWDDFFQILQINPESSLVIGDNLAEDIVVPLGMGAKCIWVNRGEYREEKYSQVAGLEEIKDLIFSWN